MTEAPDAALSPEERKKLYKQSLNLPRTSFPMKANLGQNEPLSRRRWEEMGLYERLLEARADAEPFAFHDGPPYANGSIHVGHLLNKSLKDMVVRSQALLGRRCPYVPGWDCHGLPIEHKVMTGLLESGKAEKLEALDEDRRRMAVRRECQRYAAKYQKLQAEQMKRLLTLADYEHPYLTMAPDYEAAVLEVFADMVERDIVYRDLKPVHWSIANETALAEAELEYMERDDPAVTVRFEAEDPRALAALFGVEPVPEISFLIWTTTPWTLPANLLIAVHPHFEYALAQVGERLVVVAGELGERVAAAAGLSYRPIATVEGEALVGTTYRHPFIERTGRLVAAEYVTLEDGTGLVHTAPGHGHDDYLTGMAEGTPVYSPVRGDGTFDDSAPEWLRGVSVWEGNDRILDRLRTSGHLLAEESYRHSYPHDWRSKTPVIFRCTEQWFVAVDRPVAGSGRTLRETALAAAESEIDFVPGWGRRRLEGMLEARPDWCISRQRAWGLPIPAFRRPDGSILLTPASVRAVARAFEERGSDAWFLEAPERLLEAWDPASDPQAPADLDLSTLEKMHDIFDVWLESGSSWHAVMRRREQGFPADLYLEGSDQHRGWFQLALLTALGATGRPPFRTLLTHGFIVDREGRKMSKSLGNTLEVEDLLDRFGADVCRWWVSSLAYESDIKVDLAYFERSGESYRKVRNTLRFLLSNLSEFDPGAHGVDLAAVDPRSLDAWALSRAAELRQRVLGAYDTYQYRQAHLALRDFCTESLSAFYLDALKDRLYCDRADSPRRRRAQTTMHRIVELLATLLAPILPHTADEAWRTLHGEDACVHLETPPEVPSPADAGWEAVLAVREEAAKLVEDSPIDNPLDAGLVVPDPNGALAPFAAELPDALGVSRVRLEPAAAAVEVVDLTGEPRCERSWRRDETVRLREDGGWLSDRDAEAVGVR